MKRMMIYAAVFLSVMSVSAQEDENMPLPIVWDGISADASGSMPIGNGEVAGNVWVEKDGMYIYAARNDCFSELGRLLKACRLKLGIDPCVWDYNFTQTLDFANGRIVVRNSFMTLTVMADTEYPVIWIKGQLKTPAKVCLEPEIWRTSPGIPSKDEASSMHSAKGFPSLPVQESADMPLSGDGFVGVFHHNASSVYRMSMENNHLDPSDTADPFLGRTFGAIAVSDCLERVGNSLRSRGEIGGFTIKVAVTSFPDTAPEQWLKRTMAVLDGCGPLRRAESRTRIYWNEFWDRSYMQVTTPDSVTGEKITRAYVCQRWMTAAAGNSDYPVKSNGSLFTLPVRIPDPDYRTWGECYWWQNTRLQYLPLLKTGDWDMLLKFFAFYERLMPVFEDQARRYHGADGAFFPATITQFGAFPVSDFGFGSGEPQSMWIRNIMQCPLDLLHLMADYVRYSCDERFLAERLAPAAERFLDFYLSRNSPGPDGKMLIRNTQALETYWHGVENDAPTVAGLHAVLEDFRSLPGGVMLPAPLVEKLSTLESVLPDIPVETDSLGKTVYSPAMRYDPRRSNAENPELMSVFPFRLSTFVRNADIGRESYRMRKARFSYGWPADAQTAAILGMTEEAASLLTEKVNAGNPAFRFPAYYGPTFEWIPDMCHGANIMITLQEMVMQCYDGKVHLLPAFPKDWGVRFRLAAPGCGYVKGEYSSGRWRGRPRSERKVVFVY